MTSWLTWAGFLALHLLGAAWALRRWRARGFQLVLAAKTAGLGAVLALMGVSVFTVLNLNLEQHAGVAQGAVALAALAMGFSIPPQGERMAVLELTAAGLILVELAAVVGYALGMVNSLSAPFVRLLLVSPALVLLLGYFGTSVRYLLGSSDRGRGLGYEALVGRRFLLSKSSPALSVVTAISVVGVTLGVWLVIVSLAVLSGFEHDLREKIIGAHAHILVEERTSKPFAVPAGLRSELKNTSAVVAVAESVEGEVAVASRSNFNGGVLMGIDPVSSPRVLKVLASLAPEALAALTPSAPDAAAQNDPFAFPEPSVPPGIILGAEMARALSVTAGDDVRVISPVLEVLTPLGAAPKSRGFRVVDVFSSKMYEYDSRFAYVHLDIARSFFEFGEQDVSGLQVQTKSPNLAPDVVRALRPTLKSHGLVARDWRSRNQTLFAALELERVLAFIVLAFIILVASFSIVTTLAMSIIEKRQEIAILKTMGARSTGIMKVFLSQGMVVGTLGTVMGGSLGLVTVAALERLGVWIPDEVYYIDSLPVHLSMSDLILVMLAALLIVWDFAIFPALEGARLEPVEGLREG